LALVSDNATIEDTLTYNGRVSVSTSTATANGTTTLTAASTCSQVFTGTLGQTVKMPDATTVAAGWRVEIYNQSSSNITIQNNAGGALLTLGQTSIAFGFLQTAGSAAGTWIFYQMFIGSLAGITNYFATASSPFVTSSATDVVITGMTATPVAGTYAAWYSGSVLVGTNNAQATTSLYRGGVLITGSPRVVTATGSSYNASVSTQDIVQVNGSQAIDARMKTNAGNFTTTGRSLLLIRLGT
jgi:hypothetical protein